MQMLTTFSIFSNTMVSDCNEDRKMKSIIKSDPVKKSFEYFHVEVDKEKYAKNAKSVEFL